MTYTVTLVDFPAAPPDVIHAAEARFRAALDKALGDRVSPMLTAFRNASESSANELSKEEIGLAVEWHKAHEVAMAAGFRGLGDAGAAYFEVRLG